ncbi:MAG: hypothetical protein ACK507_02330 [bacterium]
MLDFFESGTIILSSSVRDESLNRWTDKIRGIVAICASFLG